MEKTIKITINDESKHLVFVMDTGEKIKLPVTYIPNEPVNLVIGNVKKILVK